MDCVLLFLVSFEILLLSSAQAFLQAHWAVYKFLLPMSSRI